MFKKLFKILKGGISVNNKNPLHGEELNHILVGSFYAHQQQTYLNSYETGAEKSLRKKILEKYWGIYNEGDAYSKLSGLLQNNNSNLFKTVYTAFDNQKEDYASIIESKAKNEEDLSQMIEMFRHLKQSYLQLLDDKIITKQEDLLKYGTIAWDLGRGVFLARLCYESKFISLDELKSYAEECYQALKEQCHTWEDYTKSYLIGRSLWNPNSHNSGMALVAEELLSHKDSPLKGKVAI